MGSEPSGELGALEGVGDPLLSLRFALTTKATALAHHDEEILMYEVKYPGYINHVERHRRLVLRLEHLQASLALRRVVTQRAIHELRSWFALHLIGDDAPLAACLNGRRRLATGPQTDACP